MFDEVIKTSKLGLPQKMTSWHQGSRHVIIRVRI